MPQLTPRALPFIVDLCLRVKLLTVQHIAQREFSHCQNPLRDAEAFMRKLETLDLVSLMDGPGQLLNATRPLLQWRKGQPLPDSEQLAYRINTRFKDVSLTRVKFYKATKRAHRIFGSAYSSFQADKPCDITHDAVMADALFYYRNKFPALFEPDAPVTFLGEGMYHRLYADYGPNKRRKKLPDAVVIKTDDPATHPQLVVESAGRYNPRHLSSFVRHYFVRLKVPADLW